MDDLEVHVSFLVFFHLEHRSNRKWWQGHQREAYSDSYCRLM